MRNNTAIRREEEPASPEARLTILEHELEAVKWLMSQAGNESHKAAAAQRIQELERKISAIKPLQP